MIPIVRPAYDDEIEDIEELDAQCFPPDDPKLDTSDSVDWFVAVTYQRFDDRDPVESIVAYGGVQLGRHIDVWYMSRSGVRSDWRGRGLQRKLIRARERWAKRNGAVWCVTDTHPANIASSRNLIKCGYLPYWPEEPWADDSLYLSRQL